MKLSRRTIFFTVAISAIIVFLGVYLFSYYYDVLLPDVEGTDYQVIDFDGPFLNSLFFSMLVALIPIASMLTWKAASIIESDKRFWTIVIITICVILAIIVRYQIVKAYLLGLKKDAAENFEIIYPVNQLNYEYYMIGATCIGCLISYLLFRHKKANQ
jgi:hypothetical protein